MARPRRAGARCKQPTRLLRVECPGCGYLARITRRWVDAGLPECACGERWRVAAVDLAVYREMGEAIGARDRREDWSELRRCVLEQGGIAPNADYRFGDLPRSVYRLDGLPADELPLLLEAFGFHFEDADDLVMALRRAFEVAA